jgi:hypothetical protein
MPIRHRHDDWLIVWEHDPCDSDVVRIPLHRRRPVRVTRVKIRSWRGANGRDDQHSAHLRTSQT